MSATDGHRAAAIGSGRDRASIRSEATTTVLCGVLAVIVVVLVGRHGWPVWWLVIAGMLLAWAGDALWALADHLLGGTEGVDGGHPAEPGTPLPGAHRPGQPGTGVGDRP